MSPGQVLVLTAFGHGHLFPSMELCKHIASRNYKATLVIFSHLSSSIHSSFHENPLIEVVEVPSASPRPGLPVHKQAETYNELARVLEAILSRPHLQMPTCAVVNVFMLLGWTKNIFQKHGIPTVALFTSGACSPSMEYASWNARPEDLGPGEVRLLPGLPDEMGLTQLNVKRRPFGPLLAKGAATAPEPSKAGGPSPRKMGPPGPGEKPDWLDDVDRAIGLVFNTFDNLERPFLNYLANQFKKPAWGVGPLSPEMYWKSDNGAVVADGEVRRSGQSSITEDDVTRWLDSKPPGSVLFISFGSTLSLTPEESRGLGGALAESARPFIWVVQPNSGGPAPGHFPDGMDDEVGDRGLIITGWAPQLLILSHPSTGGFLSHCGWNSTIEAILKGVPFLTCPIRGDQYDNARWVTEHLKIGHKVCEDPSQFVTNSDFVKGIERLMADKDVKIRAMELRSRFGHSFPVSSGAALDALLKETSNH
ncbi:scopoletin glucosyltransferase [Eucalyptus grandis]|uniref:scopoletin glucosyltransferase n=1 Tax=Eucalyptus grandis TaxID=71139 RepID=UPI00192EF5E4|nr:scopoletin glucosyltransferase [Eucalyptus grandis]